MTAVTVNEARLREVLTFLQLHPELWNQYEFCGSTGCLAGWTVALAEQGDLSALDGRLWVDVGERARQLLGLTGEQASRLFHFTEIYDSAVVEWYRHPTFREFCERVELVTGIRFKPPIEVTC